MPSFSNTCGRIALAILIAATAWSAQAQGQWPSKALRLVVPFPPGTPSDILMRAISPDLQRDLGQAVIVENKPGATGNIGMQDVVNSTDGHSVLVGVDTMLTINPHIYKKMNFKPLESLAPVTQLASFNQMLVCHPGIPARNVQEFVDLSRKQALSYASGGAGSPGHLTMEMLAAATKVGMTHVPYKGPGQAVQDMMGGLVPCAFLTTAVVGPYVTDGRLKALAVSGSKRLAAFPQVPTVVESGVPGFDATFSEMVAVPKSWSADRIQKLHLSITKALAKPDIRQKQVSLGLDPLGNSSDEARQRLLGENTRWGAVVSRIDLQVD